MSAPRLRSTAWLLQGLVRSTAGTLELAQGRLSFVTEDERLIDTPVEALEGLRFPWYYAGGGMAFSLGGKRYRISFVEPGDSGDIISGRALGARWKQALLPETDA